MAFQEHVTRFLSPVLVTRNRLSRTLFCPPPPGGSPSAATKGGKNGRWRGPHFPFHGKEKQTNNISNTFPSGPPLPHGDQGRQDLGHHRGLLHLLLVPLLHLVPDQGILPGLHPGNPLLGHLLARILQLRHKPLHLRHVLKVRRHAHTSISRNLRFLFFWQKMGGEKALLPLLNKLSLVDTSLFPLLFLCGKQRPLRDHLCHSAASICISTERREGGETRVRRRKQRRRPAALIIISTTLTLLSLQNRCYWGFRRRWHIVSAERRGRRI